MSKIVRANQCQLHFDVHFPGQSVLACSPSYRLLPPQLFQKRIIFWNKTNSVKALEETESTDANQEK